MCRRNISLTAHVLIALTETADKLQGDVKRFSNTARHRAVKYLERYLEKVTMTKMMMMILMMMMMMMKVTDPYEVAIMAYSLSLAKSAEASAAYGKLLKMRREKGGRVYWSRNEIKTNNVRCGVMCKIFLIILFFIFIIL